MIVFYLLVGVVVTTPFILSNKLFFLVNRISIFSLLFVSIFRPDFIKDIRRALTYNGLFFATIALFLWEVIGGIYSSNIDTWASTVEKKTSLVLLAVAILAGPRLGYLHVTRLLNWFVYSVAMASAICLIYAFHRNNYFEVFTNPNWFYFSYYDLTEIINIQPIYLSLYVGFSMFCIVDRLVEGWDKLTTGSKVGWILGLVYLFVFLFLLAGKASILGAIFILVCGTFLFFARRRKLFHAICLTTAILIAVSLLVYSLPIVRERFLATFGFKPTSMWVYGDPNSTNPASEARLVKWQSGLRIVRDNWLIGVGQGDVQDELIARYRDVGFELGVSERFNAHNQYLQTWIGSGLVGLVLFLFGIFSGIRKSLQTEDYLYLAFLTFFSINCLTESVLERQYGVLFYSLFGCLLFSRKEMV